MLSPVVCTLLTVAHAYADVRVAIDNDAFTEVTPPLDDSGFTHDFALAYWRPYRGYQVGASFLDRWLTEVGGRRREDLVELLATIAQSHGVTRLHEFNWRARVGPTLTGNLGGRWMQNKWHDVSGTGPTLSQGLQNSYVAQRALGVVVGGRVGFSHGIPALQAYGWLDAQLALGTGLSSFETLLGVQAIARPGHLELGCHGEIAVDRFHTNDAALQFRGGYGTGWQVAFRVGVHVAWARYRIDYEYRSNEGGSHEPIGVVAFTIMQASGAY